MPAGAPPGSELAAVACLDLEWLQALPEGPAGGLAALDDAAPLPPNTLVLELSDGLYVHPRLALRPLPPQRSGSPAPGGAPEAPVRPQRPHWPTARRRCLNDASPYLEFCIITGQDYMQLSKCDVGADVLTLRDLQGIRNRVLQSFLRRPLFTPDSADEEAAPRNGR